uniref:Head-tail joining protein n=1 Tax=viral metagenome TaxID=1070528 RepID=A0A6M3IYH0_9ZZZZ
MAYLDLLINKCTTQRRHPGLSDDYGNPAPGWMDELPDIDCRWSTPSNREVKVGAEVVLADLQLFLGDVDITEQDRVILDMGTYEVLSAVSRQNGVGGHHMECLLRIVK